MLTASEILMPESVSSVSLLQQFIQAEGPPTNGEFDWGRLICIWHEKKESDHILTHTYAACIDLKEGGIYFDCSPRKIFAKCIAHFFARPFFTIVKTIYQLSLYPIFYEIAKCYQSVQSKQEKIKNIFKALADIFLTPIYGIILTIATAAVLIIEPFAPNNLYEGRKFLGKIEQASNWGQSHTSWTFAKCFQPLSLEALEYYGNKDCSRDTWYPEKGEQNLLLIERQLANFARARIRYKKRCFDIFSCTKLNANMAYQSSIFI